MALRTETCVSELRHFFEYSAVGVDVVADGLQEVPFGEFLVERGALTRYQLLRALMMQDRYPRRAHRRVCRRPWLPPDRRGRAALLGLAWA
jgi:hypothetical protein